MVLVKFKHLPSNYCNFGVALTTSVLNFRDVHTWHLANVGWVTQRIIFPVGQALLTLTPILSAVEQFLTWFMPNEVWMDLPSIHT